MFVVLAENVIVNSPSSMSLWLNNFLFVDLKQNVRKTTFLICWHVCIECDYKHGRMWMYGTFIIFSLKNVVMNILKYYAPMVVVHSFHSFLISWFLHYFSFTFNFLIVVLYYSKCIIMLTLLKFSNLRFIFLPVLNAVYMTDKSWFYYSVSVIEIWWDVCSLRWEYYFCILF